jgi:hypothetical protein
MVFTLSTGHCMMRSNGESMKAQAVVFVIGLAVGVSALGTP